MSFTTVQSVVTDVKLHTYYFKIFLFTLWYLWIITVRKSGNIFLTDIFLDILFKASQESVQNSCGSNCIFKGKINLGCTNTHTHLTASVYVVDADVWKASCIGVSLSVRPLGNLTGCPHKSCADLRAATSHLTPGGQMRKEMWNEKGNASPGECFFIFCTKAVWLLMIWKI